MPDTFTLDLCARRPGEVAVRYRVRMYGRLWEDQSVETDGAVGTENEAVVADLAERFPNRIYYVTEEALA